MNSLQDPRRQSPRIEATLPVQAERSAGEIQYARLHDLSFGGAGLEAESLLAWSPGDEIHVELFPGSQPPPLKLKAWISWRNGHRMGVQFTDLDRTQRRALEDLVLSTSAANQP
jgi:c-di-GMP-binding flagellar brake protein YcgR